MQTIDINLFYEFLRCSVGLHQCLSRIPSREEWVSLYSLSKRHAISGVCFYGLHKLWEANSAFTANLPDSLRMHWIAVAASIVERNELLNRRCLELQARFQHSGMRSCILKGQGVAQLYALSMEVVSSNVDSNSLELSKLRQSGDIDIWVDEDMTKVIDWARIEGISIEHVDLNHAQMSLLKDVEVEVHFIPSLLHNPFDNKKLQRYFAEEASKQFDNFDDLVGFSYPTVEFNLVYSLLHIYRHFFSSGVGLRQIMDYYFILSASDDKERRKAMSIIKSVRINRFSAALMYVMNVIFGLERNKMLCDPLEAEGSRLLMEILVSGNFGSGDTRYIYSGQENRFYNGFVYIKRNLKNVLTYPNETIWSPLWKLWHYCWRKKQGYL